MQLVTYKLEKNFSRTDLSSEDAVWIGDPCYVVPTGGDYEDIWSKLCDKMFHNVTKQHAHTGEVYNSYEPHFDGRNNIRKVETSDGDFYMWDTAHGDGCYPLLQDGVKNKKGLGVDAGCLSIVPMSLIKKWGKRADAESLGIVLTDFKGDADIYVEDGNMFWGSRFVLPTGGCDYEDHDEEWDDHWNECDEESYV